MGLPACSLVSSTLAIPIVVFGAVSLIQQTRQAKEDKDLRLKAINTHNTFLTHEEQETDPAEQLSNFSSNSSGAATSSADDNASSADRPDTATPAMLDDPARPEPVLPGAPGVGSSPARASEQEASKLPPQTAVLDRPERPEPDTALSEGDLTTHTDVEAPLLQPQASAASMIVPQAPSRPYNLGIVIPASDCSLPNRLSCKDFVHASHEAGSQQYALNC